MPKYFLDEQENRKRAKALSIFKLTSVPAEKDKSLGQDKSGFRDVLHLLFRSWPYIRPMLLGRWWTPEEGKETRTADLIPLPREGYSFIWARVLFVVVAIGGILAGLVEFSLSWPWMLLYIPVAAQGGVFFAVSHAPRQFRIHAVVGLFMASVGTIIASFFFIEGWKSSLYGGLLTVVVIAGWMVQYRISDGKIGYRVRLEAHLVYFYGVTFFQRFVGIVTGILYADLINQNIFLGEPLAPAISSLFMLPEWTQAHISELTTAQRHTLKWIYIGISLGVGTLMFIVGCLQGYYNIWIQQMINQNLRLALIERWQLLSMNYHSDHRTGDSVFRIYQDTSQVTVVINHLINLTISVFSYISCVVLVFVLSPPLALAVLLLFLPVLLLGAFAMPRVRIFSLVYRETTSDVTSTIQESFSAIRLIKAFNNVRQTQEKMERDSVVSFNAAYRIREVIARITIFMFVVAATIMIVGESFMAWWAYNSAPTWGRDLAALVGVSFVVWNLGAFRWFQGEFRGGANNLRGLLRNWMTAQDMAMGLKRVFDILDMEPDVFNKPDAKLMDGIKHEVKFDSVCFHYDPERPVLNNIDMVAKPGEITAIIGPTGSGKSTMLNLMLRLFDPQKGSISIDGVDLRDLDVLSLRSQIAIALQENVLFALSVSDNIRYSAPRATATDVRQAIEVAAMNEYVDGLPNGMHTVLADRGGKLSVGQKQRLSIARAVVRDTPILVLDEPTAALDAVTEHQVMTNLAEWGRERVIFIVTHRISTIRQADNIVYLDEGKVIETGSHDELMARSDSRYRVFVEEESRLTSGTLETSA